MKLLVDKLSPEFIFAIGTVLIHMLWQGLIIATFLGMFLILMRKSSAQSRYTTAVVALIAFPVTAIITFIKVFQTTKIQQEIFSASPELLNSTNAGYPVISQIIDINQQYLPIIVFVWFLGVVVLFLRYLGLWIYVERLKNHMITPVSDRINKMVEEIRINFEIKRKIKSLTSLKISSPMIVGHFKPVMLLPEFMTDKLTDDEVQVILQHELAHVKRNDFLVNTIQHFIEILFFFHPATWWVSSIIRKEREECCDIDAIKNEEDKLHLASALTTIHEFNLNTNTMALSFLNKKNGLFNRINNLFNNSKLATFKEGLSVAFFIFFTASLMSFVIIRNNILPKESPEEYVLSEQAANGDYLFAKLDSTGDVSSLYVNGKKINHKKFDAYLPVIDSLLALKSGSNDSPKLTESDSNDALYKKLKELEEGKNENNFSDWVVKFDDLSENEKRKIYRDLGELKDLGELSELSELSELNELENLAEFEEFSKIIEEISNENGEFNFDIDGKDAKIKMNADKSGFYMDIDGEDGKVKMEFNEDGAYMYVKEDGKVKFKMKIDSTGFFITADE